MFTSRVTRLASSAVLSVLALTGIAFSDVVKSPSPTYPPIAKSLVFVRPVKVTASDIKSLLPKPKPKKIAPVTVRNGSAPYAPSSGRCGGSLPTCGVMNCESGGNIRAENPSSSASGKWQIIDSTWGGYGGYSRASHAPESVQDERARQLWAGGAGAGHWAPCL